MNKKLLGGVAAALAGIGIFRYVSSRNKKKRTNEMWTTADIPDLTGKVAVVTGANSGIGWDTAVSLAEKRATVIMACRNLTKSQAALDALKARVPNAKVELMQLDLANQESVRRFTDEFKEKYDRLDLLINNAGIMMVPYARTVDDFESQFGTNHLGHFALTGLLLERILSTPGARVVTVSSGAHILGSMDFNNLMYEDGQGYSGARAYGRSKLANLLFTYELQRRFEAAGINAEALASHPGGSNTNLQDEVGDHWYMRPFLPLMRIMMQESAMGALPSLRAATDPNAKGGQYYGPNGFLEQRGYPVVVQSSAASHKEPDARQLWQVSEQLTDIDYN